MRQECLSQPSHATPPRLIRIACEGERRKGKRKDDGLPLTISKELPKARSIPDHSFAGISSASDKNANHLARAGEHGRAAGTGPPSSIQRQNTLLEAANSYGVALLDPRLHPAAFKPVARCAAERVEVNEVFGRCQHRRQRSQAVERQRPGKLFGIFQAQQREIGSLVLAHNLRRSSKQKASARAHPANYDGRCTIRCGLARLIFADDVPGGDNVCPLAYKEASAVTGARADQTDGREHRGKSARLRLSHC